MKARVVEFLKKEVEAGHIPGAVVSVSHRGQVVLEEAVGFSCIHPKKAPMKIDTVFDLASLTKVVGTLPAILKLLEEGEIRLDDKVSNFLPGFALSGKADITLKHLLTHTSGLPAHVEYHLENLDADQIMERIFQQRPVYEAGTRVEYSDLGFITLYRVIETVTGEKLQDYLYREFFRPLGMENTGYLLAFGKYRYAATEYSDKLETYKRGIVHDENTESMGGISGHAGLFSTIGDLQKFASMVEKEGMYEGKRILSASSLRTARKNYTPFDEEYRGIGWMCKSDSFASCGDFFSGGSYGHTGFTGTSIWFDPEAQLHVILLTNRVHFGRQPHILRLRPRLHNIIRSSLE